MSEQLVDLKLVAIFAMHYEELGRVVEDVLKRTPVERVHFKLVERDFDEQTPEQREQWDVYRRVSSQINAKALRENSWPFGRELGEVVVWPDYVIPMLKHYQRMSVTLQTLRGNLNSGQPDILLPDV